MLVASQKAGPSDKASRVAVTLGCATLEVLLLIALEVRKGLEMN